MVILLTLLGEKSYIKEYKLLEFQIESFTSKIEGMLILLDSIKKNAIIKKIPIKWWFPSGAKISIDGYLA